mmetsp:Transcript_25369/g.52824  ORF Transcript_25369/g.52824 Transcript_25369/m.52824 type:complete len:205 (-) Transcript_25369:766-1380(-)
MVGHERVRSSGEGVQQGPGELFVSPAPGPGGEGVDRGCGGAPLQPALEILLSHSELVREQEAVRTRQQQHAEVLPSENRCPVTCHRERRHGPADPGQRAHAVPARHVPYLDLAPAGADGDAVVAVREGHVLPVPLYGQGTVEVAVLHPVDLNRAVEGARRDEGAGGAQAARHHGPGVAGYGADEGPGAGFRGDEARGPEPDRAV